MEYIYIHYSCDIVNMTGMTHLKTAFIFQNIGLLLHPENGDGNFSETLVNFYYAA
jgi:hypothetical protein